MEYLSRYIGFPASKLSKETDRITCILRTYSITRHLDHFICDRRLLITQKDVNKEP